MADKHPQCPWTAGSMECLAVHWPEGKQNLCMSCQWWLEQDNDEDEEDYDG